VRRAVPSPRPLRWPGGGAFGGSGPSASDPGPSLGPAGSGSPVRRGRRRLRAVLLACAIVVPLGATAAGLALSRPSMVEIVDPAPGAVVDNSALEVFVHLPGGRSRVETLRVRLNGADVTGSLSLARNGAYGEVVRVVDGENTLEVSVFGPRWWSAGRLVESVERVRFRVRRPVDRNWG